MGAQKSADVTYAAELGSSNVSTARIVVELGQT